MPVMTDRPGDRRLHTRKAVAVPLEINVDGTGSPMRVQSSDISIGGCYVECMFPQPAGSNLRIVMWIGDRKLKAEGVVVTTTPQFGNGIKFVFMSDEDRDYLAQFLERIR
jgi:hypothetical protein